jgi:hypothetical protein
VNILTSLPKAQVQAKALPAPAPKEEAATPGPSQDGVELNSDKPQKEWTVLVWANGKTDGADRLAPSVMRELEVAGSDQNMDIVAQLGRKKRVYDKVTKDWHGVKRYHVQRNPEPLPLQKEIFKWFLPPYTEGITSPVVKDLGNADMGSSASLSEFLQWGMKEFPAKNYAVIVYGESAGFAGASIDETTGQKTTYKGMAQAIREAEKASGGDVKVVAVDGSFGAGLEAAHELKDVADILVGSQAPVGLGSLQLDMVMKDLKFELAEKGSVTPEQLAKWFVFETHANPGPLAALVNPTLSAIDLKKIDAVKQAYTNVAAELAKAIADNPKAKDALRQAIGDTQSFIKDKDQSSGFYGDFRDITHFAKNLQEDVRLGEGVHAAAKALVETSQASIIDNARHGAALQNANGLSGYLPLDAGYDLHSTWKAPRGFDPLHGYNDTSVSHGSEWTNVLKGISEEQKGNARLRKLGLGNVGIVRANKAIATLKRVGNFAFGLTSNIGNWHAWQHARGQEPGSYFGIPANVGVPLAVVGGGRSAFLGAKQAITAARTEGLKNKKQAVIDGSLATVGGLGASAAAVGHLWQDAAFIKRPAAIVAAGASIGRQAYGFYATRNAQAKAKEEAITTSLDQRVARLQAEGTDSGSYFIPPVWHFINSVASAGNADLSKVGG